MDRSQSPQSASGKDDHAFASIPPTDRDTTDDEGVATPGSRSPSTAGSHYTTDNGLQDSTFQKEPTTEELRAAYEAIFRAYARRLKLVKVNGGYQLTWPQLQQVILEFAGVIWDGLGLTDLDELRRWLRLSVGDDWNSIEGDITDRLLRIAISVTLPDAESVAKGSWDGPHEMQTLSEDTDGFSHLPHGVYEDYQKLYQESKEEYQGWLTRRSEDPNFIVQPKALYPPIVEQARTIWEERNVLSIEEIRSHLSKTVLPEDMKAFLDPIDDEDLRSAMIERHTWAFRKGRPVGWLWLN